METQTIRARFSSQEQAESVVRKLASLRGDCFRLERESGFSLSNDRSLSFDTEMADLDAPVESFGWANEPAPTGQASFNLSADIPVAASQQARTVILEAGGRLA